MTSPAPADILTLTADGQAPNIVEVDFPSFSLGQEKIISQVSVTVTSAYSKAFVTAKIQLNGQTITTSPMNGLQDTAAGDPAIRVRSSDTFSVLVQGGITPDGPAYSIHVEVSFYYTTTN